MSEIVTYKCNECPTMRDEKNHWFCLGKWDNSPFLNVAAFDDRGRLFEVRDFCSIECATRAFKRFLETL